MNIELKEYRCYVSKKLLCKAGGHGQIEVMNPENRIMNYVGPSRKHQDIGPKGQEFSSMASDLRCTKCGRLQARAVGTDLVVEIKCKYCHELNIFELEKVESARLATLSTMQRNAFEATKKEKMDRMGLLN